MGNFFCLCKAGWGGRLCDKDVNECSQENGGCLQICHNKPGSFHCACHSGFQLSSDGRTCQAPPPPAWRTEPLSSLLYP
ncbi:PREDICTED: growth arrest-specific protein 6-like [Rhinopithecus bieti]|uniref:growth arrest-specific protein 6-like n=1 Tax=Rhinopithecus bieti TaxID=61621 RepID=UPI00083C5DC8|nr:PREDICTED: growth arrest-specific protein 6-like [Rhinopithecus bieti]